MKEIVTVLGKTTVKICLYKGGRFLVYVEGYSKYGRGYIHIPNAELIYSPYTSLVELRGHIISVLQSNGYRVIEKDDSLLLYNPKDKIHSCKEF